MIFYFLIVAIVSANAARTDDVGRELCDRVTEYLNACGRDCEQTCESAFSDNSDCLNEVCRRPACHCKKNLVRHNGTCIRKDQCPANSFTCPRHELINQCGNLCELRCEDVLDGLRRRPCSFTCDPPACVCEEGYARRGHRCVPRSRCHPRYGRRRGSEPHGSDEEGYSNGEDRDFYDRDRGLGARDESGEDEEPLTTRDCSRNEYVNRCGTRCEPSCRNLNPRCSRRRRCHRPACHCLEGYVRGPKGVCVLPKHCPEVFRCPPNEEVNPCGNVCELKCKHVLDGIHPICSGSCKTPACVCRDGFARDFHNQTCIPYGACVRQLTEAMQQQVPQHRSEGKTFL